MSVADAIAPKAARGLPGATVLQILPALTETPAARAAVDVAVALLRSGARVIVAAEEGPLNTDLQGLGGGGGRLGTDSANPLPLSRHANTAPPLVSAPRGEPAQPPRLGA